MSGLTIACVRTGDVYPFDYVTKMRNMIGRHLVRPHKLVCFTDQPERCPGVEFIDTAQTGLPGWWAKMLLFEPSWRGQEKIIYFDLDTVIIGDIAPLADVPGEFAILESPVHRILHNYDYPCCYNSSVMVIGAGMASFVWTRFDKQPKALMEKHARYGDQACIEELYPDARFLQDILPRLFCNYRDLTMHPPKAAVINFGGKNKPHNCLIPWVQQAWS